MDRSDKSAWKKNESLNRRVAAGDSSIIIEGKYLHMPFSVRIALPPGQPKQKLCTWYGRAQETQEVEKRLTEGGKTAIIIR